MAKVFAQNVNKLPLTVDADSDAVEKLLPPMNACASLAQTNNTINIHPANVKMLLGECFEFIFIVVIVPFAQCH